MTSAAMPIPIREARGQRVGSLPPSSSVVMSSAAAAVLAGLSDWWAARAEAAGLRGPWLDVHWAVDTQAPTIDYSGPATTTLKGTAEEVGQSYVLARRPVRRRSTTSPRYWFIEALSQ